MERGTQLATPRRWQVPHGAKRYRGGTGTRCLALALCLALWCAVGGAGGAAVAAVAGCSVTTIADGGAGSLRQAITDANSAACASPITFAISGAGAHTITLSSALPALTANVTIDGTTQPGYAGAGTPLITVNAAPATTCFTVNTGVVARIAALTLQGATTGAISNAGTLTVADSVVQNNFSSTDGAGIRNTGTLTVTGSTLANNHGLVGSDGGAIATIGGTTTVRTSLITGNSAFDGNGLSMQGGTLIVDRTTVTGNTGPNLGGGIYTHTNGVVAPVLYVTNSTISGNSATGGGGVYAEFSSIATFTNVTISGNNVTGGGNRGGGISFDGTSVTIANTLIANNTVNNGTGPDVQGFGSGVVTDRGHNLIGKTDGTPAGTFADPTDYTGTIANPHDPGLAPLPLANNGGPTPTQALLGSSVAVNHGDATICANMDGTAPVGGVDQRGVHRPQGSACDTGAFEYLQLALNGGTLPTSGGVVTLTGTGFQPGLTLMVNGAAVPVLAVSSDGTGLTARVPAHPSGIVPANVSELFAPAPATANLTYAAFTPVLTAIGPASGGVGGGSVVTLTGLYFAPDASVVVDGMPLPAITVVNDTTITFTAPAHAVGVVGVSVTVQGLTGTKANGYTYGIVNATPHAAPAAATVGVPGVVAATHAPGSTPGAGAPTPLPQPTRH